MLCGEGNVDTMSQSGTETQHPTFPLLDQRRTQQNGEVGTLLLEGDTGYLHNRSMEELHKNHGASDGDSHCVLHTDSYGTHHDEEHYRNHHSDKHQMEAQGSAHPHVHDEESLRRLVNRLARIEGHIRGVKTMVKENRPCPEVLVQIAAVRGALDRVARIILDEHLTQCIARAAHEGNIETEIGELKAALDRFLH